MSMFLISTWQWNQQKKKEKETTIPVDKKFYSIRATNSFFSDIK